MRWLIALVLLASCGPVETGEVSVSTCPPCPSAYEGFTRCAFFDADSDWARPGMLVDDEQSLGIGVAIRQDGYMHHKFCFNTTHAAFGSANPTANGLLKNDNIVVLVESASLADAFEAEYQLLSGEGSGRHRISWSFNGRPFEVRFCPRDGCEKRVLEVLGAAQESIVFLTFSFTSDPIGERLVDQHRAGLVVRGVMEPRSRRGLGSEYERLVSAGIRVATPDTPGVMHHKAFVVDQRVAILGSYNPTASANERNAETLVITEEPAVVRSLLSEYARLSRLG